MLVLCSPPEGDGFLAANGVGLYSISLGAGDELCITCTGNGWWVSGPAVAKYQAVFGSSLSANGYQKLPSGLIIQWGGFTSSGTIGNAVAVSFPIAFPGAVQSIVLTAANASSATSVSWLGTSTSTTFNAYANIAPMSVNDIAIGY